MHPESTMNTGKTLFAQLMDFLLWTTFTRIVDRHGGDHHIANRACQFDHSCRSFPICLRRFSRCAPADVHPPDSSIAASLRLQPHGLDDSRVALDVFAQELARSGPCRSPSESCRASRTAPPRRARACPSPWRPVARRGCPPLSRPPRPCPWWTPSRIPVCRTPPWWVCPASRLNGTKC